MLGGVQEGAQPPFERRFWVSWCGKNSLERWVGVDEIGVGICGAPS